MADHLGFGTCPLCKCPTARFSVSVKQLACITCPPPPSGCQSQLFTRSDRSDELARKLLTAKPAAEPKTAAAIPATSADTAKPGDAAGSTASPKPASGSRQPAPAAPAEPAMGPGKAKSDWEMY